jgi:YegS/Rv2252/BmrU family lipid kinase
LENDERVTAYRFLGNTGQLAPTVLNEPGASADARLIGSVRRLLVIFNPTAGRRRRRRLRAVLARLEAAGCRIELRATAACGDAERLAAAASAADHDVLVVAGGDGTINEVANGLRDPRLPLALIPLGTANVLAAAIGLATDPAAIAAAILRGRSRRIGVGRVDGRRFLLMVGAGLDAHVVRDLNPRMKRQLGRLAYALATLRQLGRFPFPAYRLRIDGIERSCASVVIARSRFYGGRFLCAPAADPASPLLQVCLFERSGAWPVLRYGLALLTGRLPSAAGFRVQPARQVELLAPVGEPLQGDGDIIGQIGATVMVEPDALTLLYPPDCAQNAAAQDVPYHPVATPAAPNVRP